MESYNILFSIPVHEKPEVVIDQIININTFNENCAIIIHISAGFDWKKTLMSEIEFLERVSKIPNVLINEKRLETDWGNIIECHISNYYYSIDRIDFKYWMPCSSNELFIKKGLYEYIKVYEHGGQARELKMTDAWFKSAPFKDGTLSEISSSFNTNLIYYGQVEGSFYDSKLIKQIMDIISKCNLAEESKKLPYPREEVYFQSLAKYVCASHYENNTTYVNWNNNLNIYTWNVRKLLKTNGYFSVKRIDREIDDGMRFYIRKIIGKYCDQVKQLIPEFNEKLLYLNIVKHDIKGILKVVKQRILN